MASSLHVVNAQVSTSLPCSSLCETLLLAILRDCMGREEFDVIVLLTP